MRRSGETCGSPGDSAGISGNLGKSGSSSRNPGRADASRGNLRKSGGTSRQHPSPPGESDDIWRQSGGSRGPLRKSGEIWGSEGICGNLGESGVSVFRVFLGTLLLAAAVFLPCSCRLMVSYASGVLSVSGAGRGICRHLPAPVRCSHENARPPPPCSASLSPLFSTTSPFVVLPSRRLGHFSSAPSPRLSVLLGRAPSLLPPTSLLWSLRFPPLPPLLLPCRPTPHAPRSGASASYKYINLS